MSSQAAGFVCVVRLCNCYIATHVEEKTKKFISEHPEPNIKAAQATAKLFAETNKISYDNELKEPNKPIITVLKSEDEWFPAELRADSIFILRSLAGMNLGGTQQEAIHMANYIAMSQGTDSFPSFGISLAK